MIDMNGSIESIMEECDRIAFNEFKGEAELAYARRREEEIGTHRHNGQGARSYKDSRNQISNNRHDANMRYGLNKNNYEKETKWNKDMASTYHQDLDDMKDPVSHSIAKHNKKVNKESTSIFDTLLDQV